MINSSIDYYFFDKVCYFKVLIFKLIKNKKMRKVFLEIDLGKKFQARKSRRFPSNLKLKTTAPAIQAEALPSLALTLFGVMLEIFLKSLINLCNKKYKRK